MNPVDLAVARPNKRCSKCGAEFHCAGGDGKANCWCDALPHVGPIAGADHDCLCPNCLRAAIVAAGKK